MALTIVRRPQPNGTAADRWDPFRELLQATGLPDAIWAPPVDIEETDDAWIVEAELPGVKRKDVDVQVNDGELVISGEIKERERTGILRHRTRRTGQYEFRVTLPTEVRQEDIQASMHDGVLRVRIPRPQPTEPHRVEVGEGDEGATSADANGQSA
jgi:HSP20 family protein